MFPGTSLLLAELKRDTPRNFDMKRLIRNAFSKRPSNYCNVKISGHTVLANSDLDLPHGLAPSETMVWSALFRIWSRRPHAQGVGVDPCSLTVNPNFAN